MVYLYKNPNFNHWLIYCFYVYKNVFYRLFSMIYVVQGAGLLNLERRAMLILGLMMQMVLVQRAPIGLL